MDVPKSPNERLGDLYKQAVAAQTEQQPTVAQSTTVAQDKPSSEAVSETQAPVVASNPSSTVDAAVEEFNFEDWDSESESETKPTQVPTTPAFDFTSFVKDIGFEESDPEKVKSKIKELKSKPSDLEGVPDNLKKAVELARKGGDYLSFLKVSSVDYSQIKPEVLFEHDVVTKLGEEQGRELLDAMTPLQKKLEGTKLKDSMMYQQQLQQQQYETAAEQARRESELKKANADKALKSELDKVNEIAGLKLKPSHKQDMYEAITTGRMQKELFFNPENGEYDYKNMMETYFVKKNLPKIIQKIQQSTKTSTKKEVIRELTNPQVKPSSEKPIVEKDERTPLQKYIEANKFKA